MAELARVVRAPRVHHAPPARLLEELRRLDKRDRMGRAACHLANCAAGEATDGARRRNGGTDVVHGAEAALAVRVPAP